MRITNAKLVKLATADGKYNFDNWGWEVGDPLQVDLYDRLFDKETATDLIAVVGYEARIYVPVELLAIETVFVPPPRLAVRLISATNTELLEKRVNRFLVGGVAVASISDRILRFGNELIKEIHYFVDEPGRPPRDTVEKSDEVPGNV